jgi:hypothetical protein
VHRPESGPDGCYASASRKHEGIASAHRIGGIEPLRAIMRAGGAAAGAPEMGDLTPVIQREAGPRSAR